MRKIFWIISLLLTTLSCKKDIEFDYPLVFTGEVTNITKASATFSAKITNHGKFPIIESGFIWGVHPNDNYGIKIKNKNTPDGVYSLITNESLLPNEKFYVRAYAQTEDATTYGNEVSFDSHEDEINIGSWLKIVDETGYSLEGAYLCFTINDITYFSFWDGSFYSYDHNSKNFQYILTNDILRYGRGISATYNNLAYIFSVNSFYLFDPNQLTFNKLSTIQPEISFNLGFQINNNIYVGFGYLNTNENNREFWKYNINTDTWHQIALFPGDLLSNAFSFSINGIGYVGGGRINTNWPGQKVIDLWSYDPVTDEWQQKKETPGVKLLGASANFYGYGYYNSELFEYNPTFDLWIKMAELTDPHATAISKLFESKNKIFTIAVTEYMDTKYLQLWVYEK